ncbi:MAG: endonuclease/exonuclease/phosphatase family protein [Chthoniobacterales bacterium]
MSIRFLLISFALLLPSQTSAETHRAFCWIVYGVPWVVSDVSVWREKIVQTIAENSPDLIVLQEVWIFGEGSRFCEDLKRIGFPYAKYFYSLPFGSGLLMASRFPILETDFRRFSYQGHPYSSGGDYYGGKGVAFAKVRTPAGDIAVFNTHLHARYRGEQFYPLQVTQVLDLVDFLQQKSVTDCSKRLPVVLLGDFNSTLRLTPLQLLISLGEFSIPDGPQPLYRFDWIFAKSGSDLLCSTARNEWLDIPRISDPSDAEAEAVSDHHPVIADIALSAEGTEYHETSLFPDARENAEKLLRQEITVIRNRAIFSSAGGLLLLAAGWRILQKRRRWRGAIAFLVFVMGATLCLLGLYHYPSCIFALRKALSLLE